MEEFFKVKNLKMKNEMADDVSHIAGIYILLVSKQPSKTDKYEFSREHYLRLPLRMKILHPAKTRSWPDRVVQTKMMRASMRTSKMIPNLMWLKNMTQHMRVVVAAVMKIWLMPAKVRIPWRWSKGQRRRPKRTSRFVLSLDFPMGWKMISARAPDGLVYVHRFCFWILTSTVGYMLTVT